MILFKEILMGAIMLSTLILMLGVLGLWVLGIMAVVNTARDRSWGPFWGYLMAEAVGTLIICGALRSVIP